MIKNFKKITLKMIKNFNKITLKNNKNKFHKTLIIMQVKIFSIQISQLFLMFLMKVKIQICFISFFSDFYFLKNFIDLIKFYLNLFYKSLK